MVLLLTTMVPPMESSAVPQYDFARVMGELAQADAARMIPATLQILRRETGADAALVMRKIDSVIAETLWSEPPRLPLDELNNPVVFREAVWRNEPLLREDYASSRHPLPVLTEWGVQSIAVLPVLASRTFEGAVILLWRKPVTFHSRMRDFLRQATAFLRAVVPPSEAMRALEIERERVAAILETIPQGVAFVDLSGEHGWLNREAAGLLGLDPGMAEPARITEAIKRLQDSAEQATELVSSPLEDTGSIRWTWTIRHPEMKLRVLSVMNRLTRVRQVAGRLWIFDDITEQRRAEENLRASEERYRHLFDNNPLPSWVFCNETQNILAVNLAAVDHYGYTREEFLRMNVRDLRPASEIAKLETALAHLSTVHKKCGPWLHRKKDGTLISVEITSHEVHFEGKSARMVLAHDITERERTEQQLREQEERWQLALRGSNDGLWDYDIPNNRVFFSRRWKEILGYQEHELPNLPGIWEERVHPDDFPAVMKRLQDHLERKALFYVAEYRLRCKDGRYKWVLARGQAVWDENGLPIRVVGSHTDITERKESEEQLTREALYDSLTGLLNRRYMMEHLERAIAQAEERQLPLTIALCDVDHFKNVNDTQGHAAGDEVLAVFGQLVQQGQRQGDLAGRIGGDEFCLMFPSTTAPEAAAAVERTRLRLATMAFGVASGIPFSVTATFGVAMWRPGVSAKMLLETADRALYQAKERGRNCTVTV